VQPSGILLQLVQAAGFFSVCFTVVSLFFRRRALASARGLVLDDRARYDAVWATVVADPAERRHIDALALLVDTLPARIAAAAAAAAGTAEAGAASAAAADGRLPEARHFNRLRPCRPGAARQAELRRRGLGLLQRVLRSAAGWTAGRKVPRGSGGREEDEDEAGWRDVFEVGLPGTLDLDSPVRGAAGPRLAQRLS
jgi:hypothetical protein